MCGICGHVGIPDQPQLLERMAERLVHRGPDDEGSYRDAGVALGFRRLSIIDLETGHQPITNEDESVVLVCNGEIYNHAELRAGLESRGHRFRTRSDVEVILHLYEERGLDCVSELNGMFAAALWDRPRQRLVLLRDRLGIKPLYYAEVGGRLAFSSEMKSLLTWEEVDVSLEPRAVHDYLELRYVPGPGGLLRGIRKLPAAHVGVVDAGKGLVLRRYWTPETWVEPPSRSDQEWLDGFAERFERSISRRLMSEVPLGAYLSGGVDSSTIVAAMAARVSRPVRTYSVGFDYEHDELEQAASTAERLGCEHTEVACRISDVELLPKIVWHLDEPVGDPIVIPMYRLSQEATKSLTVVLAGEGADETLGGYLFHKALLTGRKLSRRVSARALRWIGAPAARLAPVGLLDRFFDYPASLGRRGKLKVVDFLKLQDPRRLPEAWRHLISLFDARDVRGLYAPEFAAALADEANPAPWSPPEDAPLLNRIIALQFGHWLQDDILMKQDKMSMANGLEARVPFLDHELVEYALQVPPHLKIAGGQTKVLLRRYAARVLPEATAYRKKMPFYAPVERFFHEPVFRELVADALSRESVEGRGLFRPEAVDAMRRRMESGEFVYVKQVFSLVVLELWCRALLDRRGAA